MKMKNLLIEETIPDRSFFKPQEVSALLKVKPHEIRYWESEFAGLKGHKTKNGLKLYRREEVFIFASIRHLLHEKKFTIAAAKQILKDAQDFSNDVEKNPTEAASVCEEVEAEVVPAFEPVEECQVLAHEADERELEPSHEPLAVLSNQVLHEASELLLQNEGQYDEKTHALYEELDNDETIEAIQETITLEQALKVTTPAPSSLSLEDRAKAMASTNTLRASKDSLEKLLSSLDRFKEGSFWEGTFPKR